MTSRHNDKHVTMTLAGLWKYGDGNVATGCTALVCLKRGASDLHADVQLLPLPPHHRLLLR